MICQPKVRISINVIYLHFLYIFLQKVKNYYDISSDINVWFLIFSALQHFFSKMCYHTHRQQEPLSFDHTLMRLLDDIDASNYEKITNLPCLSIIVLIAETLNQL